MRGKQFGTGMLVALFLLTVASAPWSGQQSSNSYDPWLDFNEDGVIDVNELHRIAEAYGSSGEAVRNVTVFSHATSYTRLSGASNISIPPVSYWLSEMISIDGYAKITILFKASTVAVPYDLYACDNDGHEWLMERPPQASNNCVQTYDVMSPNIRIRIYNGYGYAVTFDLAIYLMA